MQKRPIYNLEQKQEYMDAIENEHQKTSVRNYFERTYPKENEYGKDLADMDFNELRDTLLSLRIRRRQSRNHLISILRAYVKWAFIHHGAKSTDFIYRITPETIEDPYLVVAEMLSGPDQLEELIKVIGEGSACKNRQVVLELLFRLLYAGVSFEEIRFLEVADKTGDVIARKNGKELQLDKRTSELWDACAGIREFMINRTDKTGHVPYGKKEPRQQLNNSKYLFKTFQKKGREFSCASRSYLTTSFIGVVNLYTEKKRAGKKSSPINYVFVPHTIWLSGVFHRLFELEKSGVVITSEVFVEHFGEAHRKWEIDYDDWKITFGHLQSLEG